MKVTLLGRPGCSLCDEAQRELEAYLAAGGGTGRFAVEVEVINIETDDRLHRRYLERIPVILVDGEEVSEWFFDADAFEAATAPRAKGPG